ncbi:hybrid sensor histidine kinase/response regulator [Pseudomonas jinjuensis]|uniref:histidine kinase n=1 Tax=Pseudomonas jinjuensis TaxID=198616 RepID=A0A1H0CZG7_9PSED|nr:PAS domain-containing sensor histidine kinase [Pseudomonas jinjuensis]SDN63259.1 hypothetical protein SAMN05216193_10478 [Pseudomonas jinjuensis]
MPENPPLVSRQVEDARYRLLVEAVTDYAIYMLDPQGMVSSWNAGAQHFKGYTAEEILGEHFSRFYLPEECAAGLPEKALRIAASEGRYEREGWRVRKDGTRFWAHVVMDAIRSPSGELLGFAKITRDLTERRAAEEALRRSEQQFRLLVNGVTDYALYMLDPDGRITNWNSGAQRISGYAPEEIIGQHFSCCYNAGDRAAGEPEIALETARREGRHESEAWQVRKDGTPFFANMVIDQVRDESGELLGFAKITRDITDKLKAQEELERARNELIQSQKMESLGQLTGGVAHDFNNLLTVIIGGLQMLHRHLPDEPRVKELWQSAMEATRRGAALTQRMLAFARKQQLFPQPLEVPALMRGMSDLLDRALGANISIETRFPAQLDPVLSDENQLELSIINLATNARDAMPDGGVIIFSAANRKVTEGDGSGLPAGDYVCLSVSDSGCRMDAEALRRASEPFFTTKEVGKGTGLGLSIVHGIAQQQGGRLVLRSRPGQGTTAEIWLPAAQERTPRAEERMQQEKARERRFDLDVLLVDDDTLVLTGATALLDDLGCRVWRAESAAAALELLAGHEHFDLLIADYAMPGMDGLQLIQQVRGEQPGLQCVLTTGYSMDTAALPAELPRLAKPFGLEQLRRLLLGLFG